MSFVRSYLNSLTAMSVNRVQLSNSGTTGIKSAYDRIFIITAASFVSIG